VIVPCPAGFTRDAKTNKCKKIIIVTTCPTGFKKQGDKCVKIIVNIKCLPGFHYNKEKKQCEKKIKICPKNTKLVGDKCITTKCPPGSYKSEKTGKCVIKIITCKAGFVLDKKTKKCIKVTVTCPAGSSLDVKKNKCFCNKGLKYNKKTAKCDKPYVPKPPVCKKHQKLDTKRNVCVDVIVPCPAGFTRDAKTNKCKKIIIVKTCPTGFKKQGDKCVKIIVNIKCLPGFHYNKEKKQCEKKIKICPKNTKLVGDKCITTKCPPGSYKSEKTGKCVIKIITCKAGFVFTS
jgi:hypothetical protein